MRGKHTAALGLLLEKPEGGQVGRSIEITRLLTQLLFEGILHNTNQKGNGGIVKKKINEVPIFS